MSIDDVLAEGETVKASLKVEEREYKATDFRIIEYSNSKKRESIRDLWYPHIVSLALDAKRLIPILVTAIPIAIIGLILLSSIPLLGLLLLIISGVFLTIGIFLKKTVLKIIATNIVWEISVSNIKATKTFMRIIRQACTGSPKKPQEKPREETIEKEEINEEDLKGLDDLYEWK